ncbi:MAG: thioredoxin, partial [Desulfuromonas sp.]
MRFFVSLLILSLLLCATPVWAGGWFGAPDKVSVAIGQSAPDFTLKNLKGKDVKLSSYKGKVVFLNFWASWCPPCRAEMPSMERLYEVYGGKKFEMLAVNVE